ncbi:MAG: hypothetical protein AABZ39_03800 [Spirochaetota bacterium]
MKLLQIIAAVSAGLPCIFLGIRLILVWKDPLRYEQGRWVRLGVGILVMEFIVVHSGVMMAGFLQDKKDMASVVPAVGLMVLFYGIFAVAFSIAFKSRGLLISFGSIIVGRVIAFTIGQSASIPIVMAQSIISIVLYLGAVAVSIIGLPRLGITEPVARDLMKGSGGGLWIEQPHRAIGAAAFYFIALGLAEMLFLSWFDVRMLAKVFTPG